ncbi:MAG: 3,4-dihydroxy-2-butanone-4-phosphate synthase [Deltaproteobacteria bacterium]|nr:3,4-dihydroxy-2-butanone-4-phosphate synthase [Deltaproteobacteria bacterium]MBW2359804.1 3,4-dihydroxy-2-butanone-4-phosphate synthase [Deltaproteobacteria bacterium]
MPLSRVSEAIEQIRRGNAVILVDDEDRENEGDIVVAAEKITPDWVNFMAKHGRGLVCLTLTEKRAAELDLSLMVRDNSAQFHTAFTVSIEARHGVTTGISAADRATTILTAVDPQSTSRDLSRPGHVFPLIARNGGVLVRTGHTEGSVDLARMAGLRPAGVICEILKDDGGMARRSDLETFASEFGLKLVSIADLIAFRRAKEKLVNRYVEVDIDFVYGRFHTIVYRSEPDDTEHVAFTQGDVSDSEPVLVRMQTAIPANSYNPDLGLPSVLEAPMRRIDAEGRGVLVHIGQPDGGERVGDTFKRHLATGSEDAPEPTPRDESNRLRDYGIGAQILADLGVRRMRLMTNRPRHIVGLEGFDLCVDEIVPLNPEPATVKRLKPKA